MTNISLIIIYLPITLVTAVVLLMAYMRDRKSVVTRAFLVLGSMIFMWLMFEMLYFAVSDTNLARIFFDLKIPFVAFSAIWLLQFVMRFYHMEKYLRKSSFFLLSIIPMITTIFAVTSPMHTFLRKQLIILIDGPLHTEINQRGVWFWVHTGYCYILLLAVVGIVLYYFGKLPKPYRTPSVFILTGVSFCLFCNILVVFQLVSLDFDITLIGMSVAVLFMYLAIAKSQHMDFLILARNEIFHYLDECIFILDNDGTIMDANRSARVWLADMGIGDTGISFNKVLENLKALGATFRDPMEFERGIDISLSDSYSQVVYNMRERAIYDDQGTQRGLFVTCMDVTHNRSLIDRLEKFAGMDALTGLYNWRSYEQILEELDHADSLPLTVLMGDVNGLKQVNDTLGHQQGDLLLKVTAELLRQKLPRQGKLFRIGGDEFVMLIPRFTKEQAQQLVTATQELITQTKQYAFQPSIALGYAVKEEESQNLHELVQQADLHMYALKKSSRAKQPPLNQKQ